MKKLLEILKKSGTFVTGNYVSFLSFSEIVEKRKKESVGMNVRFSVNNVFQGEFPIFVECCKNGNINCFPLDSSGVEMEEVFVTLIPMSENDCIGTFILEGPGCFPEEDLPFPI